MARTLVLALVALSAGCGFLDDEWVGELNAEFELSGVGTSGWGCGGHGSLRRRVGAVRLGDPTVDGLTTLDQSDDAQELAYEEDTAQEGLVEGKRPMLGQVDPWLIAFVDAEKEVDTALRSAEPRRVAADD